MKGNTSGKQCNLEESRITSVFRQWGYRNPCLIGQGSFSHVYRVQESATGHFWACKVSAEQEMLWRESRILQQLSHPLFPIFHEYRQEGEVAFMFMEYVAGRNLGKLLATRGRLSERQTIRIAVELAEGLCYLHERNTPVLFRDLKPENIMIREDGTVKLLDLGSAGEMKTDTRVITGTLGYAAPEQWKAQERVGFHSDVYALGQIMYYMLTGKKPRGCGVGIEEWYACDTKMYRGIRQLVADCIRVETEERVPTMRSFLHRLRPYDAGQKRKILCLEMSALLRGKKRAEYIFQQNVLKLFGIEK